MSLWNNKLKIFCCIVYIKDTNVWEPVKGFQYGANKRNIKNAVPCNKNVEIDVHSKIDDGFYLGIILQLTCSDTIYTDFMYSKPNKALNFEAISKQSPNLSFEFTAFMIRIKWFEIIYIYIYIINRTK